MKYNLFSFGWGTYPFYIGHTLMYNLLYILFVILNQKINKKIRNKVISVQRMLTLKNTLYLITQTFKHFLKLEP